MATHNDTAQLVDYAPNSYPELGNPERFITKELDKIKKSIASIQTVMRLFETRMNNNGLT